MPLIEFTTPPKNRPKPKKYFPYRKEDSHLCPGCPARDPGQHIKRHTTGSHVIFMSDEIRKTAMKCARGTYQRGVLLGYFRPDGADLCGKAAKYKRRYLKSIQTLFSRIHLAGIRTCSVSLLSGGRVIMFGLTEQQIATMDDKGYMLPKLVLDYVTKKGMDISTAHVTAISALRILPHEEDRGIELFL